MFPTPARPYTASNGRIAVLWAATMPSISSGETEKIDKVRQNRKATSESSMYEYIQISEKKCDALKVDPKRNKQNC